MVVSADVPAPSRRVRIGVSLVAGCLAAARTATEGGLTDFDQVWTAARFLAAGQDPYAQIGPHLGAALRVEWPLFYPLTTVVGALPLQQLPLTAARGLFVGAGTVLFTSVLLRGGWWSGLWLLGYVYGQAIHLAQWSPLLAAAALVPGLSGLLALKPQSATVWVLATMSWRLAAQVAVVGLLLLACSLVLMPDWIPTWQAQVRGATFVRPLVVRPLAWPLLLALLLRWRRFDARLLAALAVTPMTPGLYEMVPLGLIPRGRRECVVATVGTVVAFTVAAHGSQIDGLATPPAVWDRIRDAVIVGCCYPTLAIVMRRPNIGRAPAWLERTLTRWRVPSWLSGAPVAETA
jgi:hypothetical protein